jgi:hypothetical protein
MLILVGLIFTVGLSEGVKMPVYFLYTSTMGILMTI